MSFEEFEKILKEYDYSDELIAYLWKSRVPGVTLNEETLRKTAEHFKDKKEELMQEAGLK